MSKDPSITPKAIELLNELEASQPGTMSELIRLFVADAPSLLSDLEMAHVQRDLEKVQYSAHYLRSASLALGANNLAEAALAIQKLELNDYGSQTAKNQLTALRVSLRDALIELLSSTSSL